MKSYCPYCGEKIEKGAKYCCRCGMPIHNQENSVERWLERVDRDVECLVPKSLRLWFPGIRPAIFVAGYAALLLIMVLTVAGGWGKSRHDLSGTYYTNTYFLVNSITFYQNGTFTAYGEYEELQGK